jgi:hypothetical protein
VANISLRCRRHNQYEAELIFGPYDASIVREGWQRYGNALQSAEIGHRRRAFAAREA